MILGYLILLFTIIPVIELAILIKIGQVIGLWPTIAIVIITGVSGAFLAKSQGLLTLRRMQDEVNMGIMPGEEILNGILILCGGLLLITPGLLTDITGFLAIIPPARSLIKKLIKKKLHKLVDEGKVITFHL